MSKPRKEKAIKDGKRVIGWISDARGFALPGYHSVVWLDPSTSKRDHIGGAGSEKQAIAMLREHDARRTFPKKAWRLRSLCGAVYFVNASTESEAREVGELTMRRLIAKAMSVTAARVAMDGEPPSWPFNFEPLSILRFGTVNGELSSEVESWNTQKRFMR